MKRLPRRTRPDPDLDELYALADSIAEDEQLEAEEALRRAQRLARDLQGYIVAWDRMAQRSRGKRPPTA